MVTCIALATPLFLGVSTLTFFIMATILALLKSSTVDFSMAQTDTCRAEAQQAGERPRYESTLRVSLSTPELSHAELSLTRRAGCI